jgi:signal transduction histidine kinase
MATMSHELRTPLNAIIGFSDLLLEGVCGELNEEQNEYIADIKDSADHQFDMIKHILNISKIESGQLNLNIQKFSLNSMVEQIKSNLKPLYSKKNLEFEVKGLDEEKFLYADPIRFKEILINLLSNAIKFTLDGRITLLIKEDYYNWIFKVRDTGIGIANKDFPLIFKDFQRVESTYVRSVPGTGLGLSLTKRLIELHGGEISFFSVLGVGSTFTFNIPKELEHKAKLENN